MAGFFSRLFGGRDVAEKSLSAPGEVSTKAARSLIDAQRSTGWLNGLVSEPFSGAWQRNLESANPRDPNMLAFSAVYACVTIVSGDMAKLSTYIERESKTTPQRERVYNHPASYLVERPNAYQTMPELIQLHFAAKLMRGNAYLYKEFDERGVVSELHPLQPDGVRPLIAPGGDVFYQLAYNSTDFMSIDDILGAGESVGQGVDRVVPADRIIHDRMNCLYHPLVGVSPIFASASSAMMGARILMNSEKIFANMSHPSGVLSSTQTINDVTAERLKREWASRYSGGSYGRTAVLGDGLTWSPMILNPIDAQLIDQLRFSIEDIARVFRVPLYLLADLTKTSYRNSEQMARAYYQGCLQTHIKMTEDRFKQGLNLERWLRFRFDLDDLFRMEMDARFSSYKTALDAGILSINEVRAKEGLGPVEGGNEPRVQVQYAPLSKANGIFNNAQNQDPPASPSEDPPEDDDPPDDAADGEDSPEDKSAMDPETYEKLSNLVFGLQREVAKIDVEYR